MSPEVTILPELLVVIRDEPSQSLRTVQLTTSYSSCYNDLLFFFLFPVFRRSFRSVSDASEVRREFGMTDFVV